MRQFDNLLTGPMFGYKNAEEYYKNASSYKRIPGIRTPFIALHAQDDPIVGGDLPIDQIKSNPYTLLLETSTGGMLDGSKTDPAEGGTQNPYADF